MRKLSAILFILTIPILTFAHGSHGSGFVAGFTHPVLGLDHNFAILGTGLLGYAVNEKNWFKLPIVFIAMMIIGGLMGIDHDATFIIETIIVFSVLIIGVLLAFELQINEIALLAILAGFGFTHGFAHGAEMPETTTIIKYIPGYVSGASILAVIGYIVGRYMGRKTIFGGILIGAALVMLLS